MSLSLLSEYKEIHYNCIWCVKFNPILDIFCSCGNDSNINIWEYDSSNNKYKLSSILTKVHSKPIRNCDWDYSGKYLASCSFDHLLSVWKITNNSSPFKFENKYVINASNYEIRSVSWSVSSEFLAFCTRKGTIQVWVKDTDVLDDDEFMCTSAMEENENDFKCVKFSPREDMLFAAGFDSEIYAYFLNLESNEFERIAKINNTHKGTIWCIEFNKKGDLFFTSGEDGSIKGFKIDFTIKNPYENIRQFINCENVHCGHIYNCSLTYDEKHLISASIDGKINISELIFDNDKKEFYLKQYGKIDGAHDNREINYVNCNKNKNEIVSCGDDLSIKIWKNDYKNIKTST